MDINTQSLVHSVDELEELIGQPSPLAKNKVISYLDSHVIDFLLKSPFVILSTSDSNGFCDASPRGDAAGFIKVIDDHTFIIPERPGNKRLDSIRNILHNPKIGLLFLIPGLNETLRINGSAFITKDRYLLEQMNVTEKTPKLGIIVKVDECFVHCAKAFIRSNLWDSTSWKSELPNAAKILVTHAKSLQTNVKKVQEQLEESYTKRLY
ncbi:pyridoxamine 5'-phosphate oxidase family protein [Alkalihalophilus lindianensis]|uniref:Pyridoxamine 5'-phosphate oxidase family protein n=1 Tax=Alkalihalophilus lindianensis TaxID=1630542 RepID=A0ABU3X5Z4_9BACI|nr:pyridoxamine 5'-phosphate oxidase family protein [Alkalihalophilus lindianensis]MDV2683318.1 pyridoxamine 5'-phosphate oxidase family protein [Alkalihalophilus lindianensis]